MNAPDTIVGHFARPRLLAAALRSDEPITYRSTALVQAARRFVALFPGRVLYGQVQPAAVGPRGAHEVASAIPIRPRSPRSNWSGGKFLMPAAIS
jgi:hypothetical protein